VRRGSRVGLSHSRQYIARGSGSGLTEGFNDLCEKFVACFSTSIPTKRTSTELFGVAQQESESTRTYLRRFNVEMLKVEESIESVALIRGVREMPYVESFMFSTNRSLSKVNQFMKNHI